MTTVITRLFDNEENARSIAAKLRDKRLPRRAVEVIAADGGDASAIAARLSRAMVHDEAVPVYAEHIAQGKAALVVRATYKPLGAARITRETLAGRESIVDVGEICDDYYVSDPPNHAPGILSDHPHMFLSDMSRRRIAEGGPVMTGLFPKLIIRNRRATSAIRGGAHASRAFWPMPLLKRSRNARSAIRGGRYMSKAFWPAPLLSSSDRRLKVIPGDAMRISNAMSWPTVQTRD